MICLTVDCEQWTSPQIRGVNAPENNNTEFSRLGNEKLLELLDKYKVKVTFFITGFLAEREKVQIQTIKKMGYEIGCHGYGHHYRGNKNLDLERDIIKSKKILENITKKRIIGFRAPQMQYSEKLIKILSRHNLKYDSSLNPSYFPFWINNIKYPLKPFMSHGLLEIPVGAIPGLRLPLSWFIIRVMPYSYLKIGVKQLLKEKIIPVLYVHSWEFIEIKSKYVPWYIKKNTGKKFLSKIERFIKDFKPENFITMEEIFKLSSLEK